MGNAEGGALEPQAHRLRPEGLSLSASIGELQTSGVCVLFIA